MQRSAAFIACLSLYFSGALVSCTNESDTNGLPDAGATSLGGHPSTGGASGALGGNANGGSANGGASVTLGGSANGGSAMSGGAMTGGATNSNGGTMAGGATGPNGGTMAGGATGSNGGTMAGGATSSKGGTTSGGASNTAGKASSGGATSSSGGTTSGGAAGQGGQGGQTMWPNIRVVGNQMRDRWGKPFAVRSIESMFGNGTSNAESFVAGHKALGANALGPMPNASLTSRQAIDGLLAAAYEAGLVIGLNADHTNQGEAFFQNKDIQAVVNHYPNVFLQEAVELGSNMTESQWVEAAKQKIDAYVSLYPDKPMKIGSPDGGRSPRYALDRCEDVVAYYKSKGGRGGLIFTCQLYWKAANASWSYQKENGFQDGLPGILAAIDAMAASPCYFMPGLDNQDDVGYTGWREVMDHIRESQSDPALRTSFQWWVYYNSGDSYANDLTTKASDALSGITATGKDVKAKLEMDRKLIELGPLNP